MPTYSIQLLVNTLNSVGYERQQRNSLLTSCLSLKTCPIFSPPVAKNNVYYIFLSGFRTKHILLEGYFLGTYQALPKFVSVNTDKPHDGTHIEVTTYHLFCLLSYEDPGFPLCMR